MCETACFSNRSSVCTIGNSTHPSVRKLWLADRQTYWALLRLTALHIFGLRTVSMHTQMQTHIHTNMAWLLQWHKERKVTHQKQNSPNVAIVTQPLSPTVYIPLCLLPVFCLHPSQSYSRLIIIKTLILSEHFITNTHFPFPPQRWPALQRTILQHLLPPVLVGQHPCLLTGGCVSDNPPPPTTINPHHPHTNSLSRSPPEGAWGWNTVSSIPGKVPVPTGQAGPLMGVHGPV